MRERDIRADIQKETETHGEKARETSREETKKGERGKNGKRRKKNADPTR